MTTDTSTVTRTPAIDTTPVVTRRWLIDRTRENYARTGLGDEKVAYLTDVTVEQLLTRRFDAAETNGEPAFHDDTWALATCARVGVSLAPDATATEARNAIRRIRRHVAANDPDAGDVLAPAVDKSRGGGA